jgi:GNAT superfamily N-acetyltransferase
MDGRAQLSSKPRSRVGGYFAPGTGPNAERSVSHVYAAELRSNGLVRSAPHVDLVVDLPPGVRCVRRARLEDAQAIAEIQDAYDLAKIDATDDPKRGWLVQKTKPDWIRATMGHTKDWWVAESDEGRIVAFQAVTPARYMSRPAAEHTFFGPHAKRAAEVLQSGKFIYMSQIATAPSLRGKGLAAALQTEVLKRYAKYPLLAHVAVFTQADFDAWDGDKDNFAPRTNNIASHRYHQKQGYVPVAWTSDLAGTDAFNSGLEPSGAAHERATSARGPAGQPSRTEGPGVLGILYVHFRDGASREDRPYIDPVKAVLEAPRDPAHARADEPPFPAYEPSPDFEKAGQENGLGGDYADIARHLEQMLRGRELRRLERE